MKEQPQVPDSGPLLTVRFTGQDLDTRSVPIYELGETLIAVQDMVRRTYLFRQERLRRNSTLHPDERRQLALRLQERRPGSDLYVLMPFLQDPFVTHLLDTLVDVALTALLGYAGKTIVQQVKRIRRPHHSVDQENLQLLAAALYPSVHKMTKRIDNFGGIRTIELAGPPWVRTPPVIFDPETKAYVASILHERVPGEETAITGRVTRLNDDDSIADVEVAPRQEVRVHLSDQDYQQVRYGARRNAVLTFRGRPIDRLGNETSRIEEFEATAVRAEGPDHLQQTVLPLDDEQR